MNEYDVIIKKLGNMGIYCWIENGQVIYKNNSIGIQNDILNLHNNQELVSQEYSENDIVAEEEFA